MRICGPSIKGPRSQGGSTERTREKGETGRWQAPERARAMGPLPWGPAVPLQALVPVTLLGNCAGATFFKGGRCYPAEESPPGQVTFLKSHPHGSLAGMLARGSNSLGQFSGPWRAQGERRGDPRDPPFQMGTGLDHVLKSLADSLLDLSYSLYSQHPT